MCRGTCCGLKLGPDDYGGDWAILLSVFRAMGVAIRFSPERQCPDVANRSSTRFGEADSGLVATADPVMRFMSRTYFYMPCSVRRVDTLVCIFIIVDRARFSRVKDTWERVLC